MEFARRKRDEVQGNQRNKVIYEAREFPHLNLDSFFLHINILPYALFPPLLTATYIP